MFMTRYLSPSCKFSRHFIHFIQTAFSLFVGAYMKENIEQSYIQAHCETTNWLRKITSRYKNFSLLTCMCIVVVALWKVWQRPNKYFTTTFPCRCTSRALPTRLLWTWPSTKTTPVSWPRALSSRPITSWMPTLTRIWWSNWEKWHWSPSSMWLCSTHSSSSLTR